MRYDCKVRVLQEDINNGVKGGPTCPLQLALERQYPPGTGKYWTVGLWSASLVDAVNLTSEVLTEQWFLGPDAYAFRVTFDSVDGGPNRVTPGEYSLWREVAE